MSRTLTLLIITCMVLTFSMTMAFARDAITPEQASGHIDKFATVCGKAVEVIYMPELPNRPTFVYLDKSFPNQIFEIVIWGDTRSGFAVPPETLFSGKQVCVEGVVINVLGIPQVVVDQQAQVSVIDESK